MPGTIHVSVMGFVGLPFSLPSSSISIKVSMGKREYRTSENGDFSFPLVSLRENLIIALYDTEGNQISHTGIETISVVEKGLWVNHFPLDGGGHVHLKLQFILSEEDRKRIRMMREAALKKNRSELLNNSPQSPDTASSISNTAASSFFDNREVSAHSTREMATEASMLQDPVNLSKDPQYATGVKEVSAQVSMVSIPVSLSTDPQSTTGIEEETHIATQDSVVSSLGSLSTDPLSSTGIVEETYVATQASMVADPVSLSTDPQSATWIQEDTHVARQVSMVSNPVSLSRDPQSSSGIQEQTHVATQVSLVSNPVSLSMNRQSTTGIKEETRVASKLSMVSNPVSLCTAPQSTTGIKEKIHVAKQLSMASNPVGSKMDPQSTTGIQEQTHVSTQVTMVSNPVTVCNDPQSIIGTAEENHVSMQDSIISNPIIIFTDPQSPTEEEQTQVDHEEQRNSDDTDTSEAPSSTAIAPQAIEVNRTEASSQESIEVNKTEVSSQGSTEEIEPQSAPINEPLNPKFVLSQIRTSDMAVKVKKKSFSFLPRQEEDQDQDKEKRGLLAKTTSSVRKMISAFESTQVQDKIIDLKPSKLKTPSSKFLMEAPSKGQESKAVKAELTKTKPLQVIDASKSTQPIQHLKELSTEHSPINVPNSSFKDESSSIVQSEVANKEDKEASDLLRETTADQDKPLDYEPSKIQTSSHEVVTEAPLKDQELKESTTEQSHYGGVNSSFKDGGLGVVQSEVGNNVDTESPNPIRVSIDEEPTSSGQMYTSCSGSGDSWASLAMVESTQVICTKDAFITDLQRVSNDTLASLGCDEDEQDLSKSSSTWIFPDEAREICVTTGCMAESATTYRRRTNFFAQEISMHNDNTSCTSRDSDLDNSAKIVDCRGPLGQVIKIAIMVGFGTLLFIGQSRKRYKFV